MTSDEAFESADIQPVARRLGGEVISLRNTLYTVSGKPVKLNTIVTASSKDADKIMFRLRKSKPDDFILRNGVTIYEFVGTNDVIPDMRAGKAHLQASRFRRSISTSPDAHFGRPTLVFRLAE